MESVPPCPNNVNTMTKMRNTGFVKNYLPRMKYAIKKKKKIVGPQPPITKFCQI